MGFADLHSGDGLAPVNRLWALAGARLHRPRTQSEVATTTRARIRSGPLKRVPYDAPSPKSSPGGCCGHTLAGTSA